MEILKRIQRELKAPKNQFNSFGKYKYRSCEDILEAVKPLLGDSFLTLSDEMIEVGGRVYVKATATLTSGSESVSVTANAREAEDKKGMDDSQITGTSSSYSRKYALNGLFLIDDTKDADATNKHGKTEATPPAAKPVPTHAKVYLTPTHKKWAGAVKSLHENAVTIEKILASYNMTDQDKNKLLDEAI